jgi:hypothetical protein
MLSKQDLLVRIDRLERLSNGLNAELQSHRCQHGDFPVVQATSATFTATGLIDIFAHQADKFLTQLGVQLADPDAPTK